MRKLITLTLSFIAATALSQSTSSDTNFSATVTTTNNTPVVQLRLAAGMSAAVYKHPIGTFTNNVVPTGGGGDTSTNVLAAWNPTGSPENGFAGDLGFQFSVASSIQVTALGRYRLTGNSQTHTMRIYRASSTNVVADVSVNVGSVSVGEFAWTAITPVTLGAGTYFVLSSETNGGDTWYEVNGLTVTPQTGAITVLSGAYVTGGVGEPTANGDAGHAYGPVSFKYQP